MNAKLLILGLVGLFAVDTFAACPIPGNYCEGKLEYLWVGTDGKVRTNIQNWNTNLPLLGGLILDPDFLGASRFDRMYSEMMSALYRDSGIYVEYDSNTKNITTFAVYNPEFQSPQ